MKNKNFKLKYLFTFFFFVVALVLSKVINHSPNFSPLVSLVIISSFIISDKVFLISIIFFGMIVSDLILGLYNGISFLYLVLFFICLSVTKIFKKINFINLLPISLYSSLVFYLLTNPLHIIFDNKKNLNLDKLTTVYLDGIPFFLNTLFSTIVFNYLLYLLFLFITRIINNKKFLNFQ